MRSPARIARIATQSKSPAASRVAHEQDGAYTFRRSGKKAASVTIFVPQDDEDLVAPAMLSVSGKDIGWAALVLGKVFKPF